MKMISNNNNDYYYYRCYIDKEVERKEGRKIEDGCREKRDYTLHVNQMGCQIFYL